MTGHKFIHSTVGQVLLPSGKLKLGKLQCRFCILYAVMLGGAMY